MRFKARRPGAASGPRPVWPDGPEARTGRGVPLFVQRPPLRKLRVVIDAALLDRIVTPGVTEGESLLASLIHHQSVSLLRYADGGSPEGMIEAGDSPLPRAAKGWVIGPPNPLSRTGFGQASVLFSQDGVDSQVVANFGAAEYAAEDFSDSAYPHLSRSAAATQRGMDVVAVETARAVAADLFITERPYLYTATWNVAADLLVVRPAEALPLMGLYLRAQNHFTIRQSFPGQMGGLNINRGGFYTIATYDLLPSLAQWYGACTAHSAVAQDDGLAFLAGAVVHRFQRALQDRDRVWICLNRRPVGDAGEDALDALDGLLLRLMGAVDVTARVARTVLALDDRWERSGWTSYRFREAVRALKPDLADVFQTGSAHRLTLDVLAGLRNTIHHTALPEIRISEGRTIYSTKIEPRGPERDLVLQAADALGGRAVWGVDEPMPGDMHIDPGELADQLILNAAKLIVAVQHATPVERLSGVRPGQTFVFDSPIGRYGVDASARVRLQLGLGTASRNC